MSRLARRQESALEQAVVTAKDLFQAAGPYAGLVATLLGTAAKAERSGRLAVSGVDSPGRPAENGSSG